MAQLFADQDVATLRAMAHAAGVPDADQKAHRELVAELRRAGLAEPTGGPVDTSLSDPGDPGTEEGFHHGKGVGRRESVGGPAAQTSTPAARTSTPKPDLVTEDDGSGVAGGASGGSGGGSGLPGHPDAAR